MRAMFVRAVGEQPLTCGLYQDELNALSRYNAERSRGLLHDPEWAADMAALQQRFDMARGVMDEPAVRAALGLGPIAEPGKPV